MNICFKINYSPHWAELLRMNGWKIAILGSCETLGFWAEDKAVAMCTNNFRSWEAAVDFPDGFLPFEYKFILYNPAKKSILAWEEGENRYVNELPAAKNDTVELTAENLQFDLPPFRGAGIAVPVFSLRSEASFGIGEFLDLQPLTDWAAASYLRMIQTLPVNDTTLKRTVADSYPYNTLSVFALNPLYLRLQDLGILQDKKKNDYFEKKRQFLNAQPEVDYENVCALKWEYFELIYAQEKKTVTKNVYFKMFFRENKAWLLPYSVFSFLRDKYKTADFSEWKELSVYSEKAVADFFKKHEEEVNFYVFLQFHAHRQLRQAHEYAASKGILLKGDIPIGVSPHSVDVWQNPTLFNTGAQAGAPPDDFSEEGQNWGFPTYNWEEMLKDDLQWWKDRLSLMARYFDAYRIDHILGFFRIWEIPQHAPSALLGQFYKALPLTASEIEEYGLPFDVNVHTKAQNATKMVLFLPDHKEADKFHPRISYRINEAYHALSDAEKTAYQRLYEDFFYHRHNEFWQQEAMKKLPLLVDTTSMLCCGEDLGMIPAGVAEVMNKLQILSLEIQRMPKIYGHEFGSPYRAPYLSVCTTSTHDMSPMRLWWTENHEARQRFFNQMLYEHGQAPNDCEPWIAEKIVRQHLQSPAMWTVLPLQDWLAMDGTLRNPNPFAERINVPDNPNNIWNYRMHISLEHLLSAGEFTQKVGEMIERERG